MDCDVRERASREEKCREIEICGEEHERKEREGSMHVGRRQVRRKHVGWKHVWRGHVGRHPREGLKEKEAWNKGHRKKGKHHGRKEAVWMKEGLA